MAKLLFKNRLERQKALEEVDIYPVISSEFCRGRKVEEVFLSIAEGGAKMVQIREKNRLKKEIFEIACKCRQIADSYGMLLIINDHVDVALAVGADGVHLGQDDLPLVEARRIAPELILGHSTHNAAEAIYADANGADYLNIGPIYPTKTKSLSYESLGIAEIDRISPMLHIPFTVMGGIKERHLAELIAHGAKHIAMVTEITEADDITRKVIDLRRYWEK
ncbi:MAG: thiamine phosphate synthase [Lentisphaeria bacterium]|nr:thiamine phosphate synthase [Lentisphaeria bacterium]